jgi:hypothetical protein
VANQIRISISSAGASPSRDFSFSAIFPKIESNGVEPKGGSVSSKPPSSVFYADGDSRADSADEKEKPSQILPSA